MSRKAERVSALRALQESRRGGTDRTAQVDFAAKKIFDELNDDEYAKHVAERRRQGEFVEDDEGLGYADDGEEHESGEDDFAEEEDDAAGEGEGGASGGAGAGATHKAAARRSGPLVQSASKVEKSNVFKVATEVDDLASSAASAGYKKSSGARINFEEELDEIGADDDDDEELQALMEASRKAVAATTLPTYGLAAASRARAAAAAPAPTPTAAVVTESSRSGAAAAIDADDGAGAAAMDDGDGDHSAAASDPASASADVAADASGAHTGNNAIRKPVIALKRRDATAAPAAAVVGTPAAAPKLVTAPVPSTPSAALEIMPGALVTSATDAQPSGAKPMTFDQMIAKDGTPVSSCLFYWLDAFEDHKTPGQLYVFGKVMVNEAAVVAALRHNIKFDQLARAKAAANASSGSTASSAAPTTAAADEDADGEMSVKALAEQAALSRRMPVPIPQYASACLTVTGLERCMFVLPRERRVTGEPVDMKQVFDEVDKLMGRVLPANQASSFGAKVVTRNYSFELAGVPRAPTQYLKLVYSSAFPTLPEDIQGETFSRIFGSNTTNMEHFLLKRKLQGPCWLRVNNVRNHPPPMSHCTYQLITSSPKNVVVQGAKGVAVTGTDPAAIDAALRQVVSEQLLPLPVPELHVVSIAMKTALGDRGKTHEVVVASIVSHTAVSQDAASSEDPSLMRMVTFVRPLNETSLPTDFRPLAVRHPSIKTVPTERDLLSQFLRQIELLDPDVLVGHNIVGFDLDVLLNRTAALKVGGWSRLGRLVRTQMPMTAEVSGRRQYTGVLTAGRLNCDTYLAAAELLPRETTHSLTALAQSLLRVTRKEIEPLDVPGKMLKGADCLELCQHTQNDAVLSLRMMNRLQVLPLTKQLTNLAGNLWSRSLKGARAERIEYLLLHEFHKLKYIVPNKAPFERKKKERDDDDDDDDDDDKAKNKRRVVATGNAARFAKGRSKAAYVGGLVLEPKKGLYDKYVLLLDFQSLYPSIIQEYNICFTTVTRNLTPDTRRYITDVSEADEKKGSAGKRKRGKAGAEGGAGSAGDEAGAGEGGGDGDQEDGDAAPEIPAVPDEAIYTELGVLPRVIRNLVLTRRAVKRNMDNEPDPTKREQYDIRQKALKILANSMYGCLGFKESRFFAKPIAALVTAKGREILQNTVDLATNNMSLDVIYGDTDSVMIFTNSSDLKAVRDIGNKMKQEVNKLYKRLEIEIDGIFAMMLLLKKKKYAALKVSEGPGGTLQLKREVKGLDLVRREWCPLSKQLGMRCLDIILSRKEREEVVEEIHTQIAAAAESIRKGQVNLDLFVITKGLNKAPEDYPDKQSQPHLQVALAMLARGKRVNVGDHIPYVICREAVGTVELANDPTARAGSPSQAASAGAAVNRATSPTPMTDAAEPSSPRTATSAVSPPQSPTNNSPSAPASPARPSGSLSQRAYHPDDVRRNPGVLHIDADWYLTQQLLPPITRLCEPIAGTSPARLAEIMGLDASRFGRTSGSYEGRDSELGMTAQASLPDSERFRSAERLMVRCLKCGQDAPFPGVFVPVTGAARSASAAAAELAGVEVRCGLRCTKPGCEGYMGSKQAAAVQRPSSLATAQAQLSNAVTLMMQKHLRSYQQFVYVCEDALCASKSADMTARKNGYACLKPGCNSLVRPEQSASALHLQLKYLDTLFDVERSKRKVLEANMVLRELTKEEKSVLDSLHAKVRGVLATCAYDVVQLSALTAYVAPTNAKIGVTTRTLVAPKSRAAPTPAPKLAGAGNSSLPSEWSTSPASGGSSGRALLRGTPGPAASATKVRRLELGTPAPEQKGRTGSGFMALSDE